MDRPIKFFPLSVGVALAVMATAGRGAPPPGEDMEPSFVEEFDGSSLRPSWGRAFRPPGSIANRSLYGNHERQVYFDRAFLGAGIEPVSVAKGILTITARPLPPDALALVRAAVEKQPPDIRGGALKDVRYSSGLITTRGSFAQLYGYFEMRARWTGGRGIWPAFWLLPEKGGWPPEIDILEAHGDKPTIAFQSLHSKRQKAVTRRVALPSGSGQFHSYGVLWKADSLDYYIDGVKTASIPATADLTSPMYLVANLAIGGKWPGDPTQETEMPARMEIDHIRVWKFRAAPR